MIEIVGRYNSAVCYTDLMDPIAREQIEAVCNEEAFARSVIRIMPDVHAGRGCTIGTTMTIVDKVAPAMVGVDIGCGMYTVALGRVKLDLQQLDKAVHTVPCGREVWEERQEAFDLTQLRCYDALKGVKRLECSLGTLGGGNHFVEVDVDEDGKHYLVVHSGSRSLGKQVAEWYQQVALDLNRDKEGYLRSRNEVIRTYKEQGRQGEIQATLKRMDKEWAAKQPTLPRDLCFLYGEWMEAYLQDIAICQQFARRSRERMAASILEQMGLVGGEAFHTVHNYIDVEERVLRKGAVSAKKGERLLVPINMRDGSLLCIGKGNAEWNHSAPHGAGRLMSRNAAFERLTMEEYRAQMAGIYTTCVTEATLDEAPMAYKPMEEIVSKIGETAQIVARLRPIYNFKAAE